MYFFSLDFFKQKTVIIVLDLYSTILKLFNTSIHHFETLQKVISLSEL